MLNTVKSAFIYLVLKISLLFANLLKLVMRFLVKLQGVDPDCDWEKIKREKFAQELMLVFETPGKEVEKIPCAIGIGNKAPGAFINRTILPKEKKLCNILPFNFLENCDCREDCFCENKGFMYEIHQPEKEVEVTDADIISIEDTKNNILIQEDLAALKLIDNKTPLKNKRKPYRKPVKKLPPFDKKKNNKKKPIRKNKLKA